MTIKVVGYWDLWFSHRENEYDASWRFMLKHFGVDEVILIPDLNAREKIPLDHTEVPLVERNSLEEVLAENSALTPVAVDERGATSLRDFSHPEDVLYVFGRTGFSPLDTLPDWSHPTVLIEGAEKYLNATAMLHANQACSIVLYDRLAKSWL